LQKIKIMSDLSGSDSILSGFLLIKSQNGFNIKQNPKKVSHEMDLIEKISIIQIIAF
jgi:hypothetical protein